MGFNNKITRIVVLCVFSTLVVACGGDGPEQKQDPSADITAPDSPSDTKFKRLTGGRVIVSGEAEAKSTVTITFDDGSTVSAIVPDSGKYSATSPKPVLTNKVEISVTDLAGNESDLLSINIPPAKTLSATLSGEFNPAVPLIGLKYKTSLYKSSGSTNSQGKFSYKEGETLKFTIAGHDYTLYPHATNNQNQLLPVTASADAEQNLKLILINLDEDANFSNGINLTGVNANIDANLSTKEVTQKLYKQTGRMPELLFSPSLGVNTEAPQGDGAVGQPMPFTDVFHTARPFAELSGDADFDDNGWPTQIDTELGFARTKLFEGALKGSIPSGTYTVLYEGQGTIQIGGRRENYHTLTGAQQGFTFDWNPVESDDPQANAINIVIKDIGPGDGNYIKNIQIIMPGGICKNNQNKINPFIHVNSSSDCPANTQYQSFVDRKSKSSRNSLENIIFNPDYLSFLREFKVVRMMNLMEASHGKNTCPTDDGCPDLVDTWENRSRLTDSVWGGTPESSYTERNGIPVEVLVSLANTLKRDIWVNMPHPANNEYVSEFAKYVYANLDAAIKVYLEYSNEIWNSGFTGHAYVATKGAQLGLDTIPANYQRFCDGKTDEEQNRLRCGKYFAGLNYYTQRSRKIFDLWKTEFKGNTSRLKRILGTSQGDIVRTDEMIKYMRKNYGKDNIDAIAMAPYFYGCTYRPKNSAQACHDAPKILPEVKTVDEIFDIIDQEDSVHSLKGTIDIIKKQLTITSKYDLNLVTYEGGQHLTTTVMKVSGADNDEIEAEKARFRELFKQANRDPRMKQRYETLLNEWKKLADDGATLFTLYTLPQSFYRHGNWGLKEHLNKSRKDSPKYDGVMSFQESAGKCWWEGCSP